MVFLVGRTEKGDVSICRAVSSFVNFAKTITGFEIYVVDIANFEIRPVTRREQDALRRLDGMREKPPSLERFFFNSEIMEYALACAEERGERPW